MKRLLILILLPLILFAAEVNFEYFSAKSNGDQVILEWKMLDDANINYFQVEKKIDDTEAYRPVGAKIKVKGDNQVYRFTDDDTFFKQQVKLQSDNIQAYRVKCFMRNNDFAYSNITYVTHNVNSVKKTWGMLKEMFR